jgi:hypothetical protein
LYAKYSTRLTAAPTSLLQPSYLAQEVEILEDYGSEHVLQGIQQGAHLCGRLRHRQNVHCQVFEPHGQELLLS